MKMFISVGCMLVASVAFCVFSSTESASACQQGAEERVTEQADDQEPAGEDEDEGVAVQAAVAFGGMPSKAKMLAAKQFELRQSFAVRIDQLDRICDLTEKQTKRLKIASKGAVGSYSKKWVERYMEQFGGAMMVVGDDDGNVEDEKEEQDEEEIVEINEADEIDQMVSQMLMNDMNPFQGRKQGPFENKIWVKSLKATLTDAQQKTLQAWQKERDAATLKLNLDFLVNHLSRDVRLTEEQEAFLRSKLKPEMAEMEEYLGGMYDSYILFSVAAKVKAKDLESKLSKAQVQRWKMLVAPYAQFGQMIIQEAEIEAEFDDEESDENVEEDK